MSKISELHSDLGSRAVPCEPSAIVAALTEALSDLVLYHDVPGPQDAVLVPLLRAAIAALRKAGVA